jgi:hypothetical protein
MPHLPKTHLCRTTEAWDAGPDNSCPSQASTPARGCEEPTRRLGEKGGGRLVPPPTHLCKLSARLGWAPPTKELRLVQPNDGQEGAQVAKATPPCVGAETQQAPPGGDLARFIINGSSSHTQ